MRFFLTFFIFIFFHITYAQTDICQQQANCVAIVDAGSTGSRLYVYTFDLDHNQQIKDIHKIYSQKITPGIASLTENRELIDRYLHNLFQQVTNPQIPVYFYATAGMRLLPESKQQQTYQWIKDWFTTHTHGRLVAAQTITGQEEGKYDWLAINYDTNSLNTTQAFQSMIDIGGASVEIAFPVPQSSKADPDDLINMNLNKEPFTLLIHSFLGLGTNEILKKLQTLETCFSKGYVLLNGSLGLGDAYHCQQQIAGILHFEQEITPHTQQAMQENLSHQWYVLGAGAEMAKSKPFTFNQEQFELQDWLQQVDKKICSQNWQTLTKNYPDNPYLAYTCLNASYLYSLFVNGFGMSPKQVIHYNAQDSISWTIGALLDEAMKLSVQ